MNSTTAAASADDTASPSDPRLSPHYRDKTVIAVIGVVHSISHFFHLLLVPLFPYLRAEFGYSYTELGLLMTAFFVISGLGQSAAGFLVDKVGAIPVLMVSLAMFAVGALVLASSTTYWMLAVGMGIAGFGNAPFHPIDFSIMNARVRPAILGRAYAVHGISGTLGWAFAPLYMATLASWFGWRGALVGAALLALGGLLLTLSQRRILLGPQLASELSAKTAQAGAASQDGVFDFLRIRAVWLSFLFFALFAFSLGGVQSFAPAAAGLLHGLDPELVALCLTVYMVCSATGSIPGGYVAASDRVEKMIALGFGGAALVSLGMVVLPVLPWMVPVMFGMMGFSAGFANPSRDLLVRRAAPAGATGRVYGVVYSGLDVGMASAPALYGMLLDSGHPAILWMVIASLQFVMIGFAFVAGYSSRPVQTKTVAGTGG
ncbi:MAG: MFS transporter [Burkholderiaceae bacterium]